MIVKAIKTRIFKEGENLVKFIQSYIPALKDGDILVVTSKIVALSERRTKVIKNKKTKSDLIVSESQWAMPTKYVWLTIKDGIVMASAGIDESNANGKLIMLPKDSFRKAQTLWKALKNKNRIKRLGVIITDSRTTPLRAGVTGQAVGYAGFSGIRDYRGQPDIFGRKLKLTRTDVAGSLSASAVLLMGEGQEQCPLAIIKNAPVDFCSKVNKNELHIAIEDDIYGPLFENYLHPDKI